MATGERAQLHCVTYSVNERNQSLIWILASGVGGRGGRIAERSNSTSAEKRCTRERFSGTEDPSACRIFQSSPVVDYDHFITVTLPSTQQQQQQQQNHVGSCRHRCPSQCKSHSDVNSKVIQT